MVDVWEYFESKQREVKDFGLVFDDDALFAEEAHSNGERGRVWGRIGLTDRAFLNVSERVEVQGSGIHRTDYAYYLIIDGKQVWGYERDPTHDPAVHRHDGAHKRYPCEPISFKDALTKAWESAGDEEAWGAAAIDE